MNNENLTVHLKVTDFNAWRTLQWTREGSGVCRHQRSDRICSNDYSKDTSIFYWR
jgi:hypothetical protein